MRVLTPEMAWHGRDGGKNDPILSVTFHPTLPTVLATGGGDNEVKIWRMNRNLVFKSSSSKKIAKKKGKTANAKSLTNTAKQLPFRFVTSLQGHMSTVNVVRFSPSGNLLASAGDDASLLIWSKGYREERIDWSWSKVQSEKDLQCKILKDRGDIYDLQWSRDSTLLIAGSVNNEATVWDIRKGTIRQLLKGHTNFVQGVAWDPYMQFAATQSADKTIRVYTLPSRSSTTFSTVKRTKAVDKEEYETKEQAESLVQKNDTPTTLHRIADANLSVPRNELLRMAKIESKLRFICTSVIKKRPVVIPVTTTAKPVEGLSATTTVQETGGPTQEPLPKTSPTSRGENDISDTLAASPANAIMLKKKKKLMFYDESVPTFFRRLDWSPDGSLLIAPTGFYKDYRTEGSVAHATTFGFLRGTFDRPAFHIQSRLDADPSICVRFCPKLFRLSNNNKDDKSNPETHTTSRLQEKQTVSSISINRPSVANPSGVVDPSSKTINNNKSGSSKSYINLPYKMVFAIATLKTVEIYDTESLQPIAHVSGLHYASLHDLAWSADGRFLIVSSSDGYCSLLAFSRNELGTPLKEEECSDYPLVMKSNCPVDRMIFTAGSGYAKNRNSAITTGSSSCSGMSNTNTIIVTNNKKALGKGEDSTVTSTKKRRITPLLLQARPNPKHNETKTSDQSKNSCGVVQKCSGNEKESTSSNAVGNGELEIKSGTSVPPKRRRIQPTLVS
eukprot:g3099.t1